MTAKKGHAMPGHQLMCNPTKAHLPGGQDLSCGASGSSMQASRPKPFQPFHPTDPVLSIAKGVESQPQKALSFPSSKPLCSPARITATAPTHWPALGV